MKKLAVLFIYAITCIVTSFSCIYIDNNGNSSFSISESPHAFSMNADFNKGKTRAVEEYMDKRIGRRSNMSFVNSRIDGTIALDDQTIFYIKKYPGFIDIELDKDKNSDVAYRRIKSMCEGIKRVLAK